MVMIEQEVVLYLHSTSNHNALENLIPINFVVLYLHSTSNHNLESDNLKLWRCCIISSFYIKPQQALYHYAHARKLYYIFILHQTTTDPPKTQSGVMLYYIFILHQTTTYWHGKFMRTELYYIFILHQTTTHNLGYTPARLLYYIFILHQTTT